MAYGTKYFAHYKSGDAVRSVYLKLDGYSGAETEWFCSISAPHDDQGDADKLFAETVVSKIVRLEFLFDQDYDLTEFVAEPRTYKIIIMEGANLIFEGWVEPYNTSRDYHKPRYFVRMTATCGLNRLSKNIFQQTEFNEANLRLSYFEILQKCLATIGIDRNLRIGLHTYQNAYPSAPNPLLSCEVDVYRYFIDGVWMDCLSVVADILDRFNAQLYVEDNVYIVRSSIDHALGFDDFIEYAPDGTPGPVTGWSNLVRDINYESGSITIGDVNTLDGGQVSLQPRVRKYITEVDFGGLKESSANGGLQLWDVNGPVGWEGNMMPGLGGNGWTKVETGIEGHPYAMHIKGKAPQPYYKTHKKGIWPFRKTVKTPIEPAIWWETSKIEYDYLTTESITVGFEYYTEANSAGFLYTVAFFAKDLNTGKIQTTYLEPTSSGPKLSADYQLLTASPHPRVNPETGITQSKGRVEHTIDFSTAYGSKPMETWFRVWFYFSVDEAGKSGDEYWIYNVIGDVGLDVEKEVPEGDSHYKSIIESNPYESDEGDTIKLITGDYSKGFFGTTYGPMNDLTGKWSRRGRAEAISIYRAMMADRLAVTYHIPGVIEAELYISEGEDITYSSLLRFVDIDLTKVYKITRLSFNHYKRIASVVAVELTYNEPEEIKQRSYTDARGLLDETDGGDVVYPGSGTTTGRINVEGLDEYIEEGQEDEVTPEELANSRTGVFEDVPALIYTVNEQSTSHVDLADYLSEFYLETEQEDDIEEEDRHDPANFVLSVVSKPSWLSSVSFDGLLVSATAKPTVVGEFELELSVVDDTFGIVPNVVIPIKVYPKTTIKYTLRDTSGTEPLGVGNITNGSAFLKPDTWDILVQITGHHEGWYAKLTGMGISVTPTADPYSLVSSTDSATYIIGSNIDSEVGIYNLILATYRDEGEPDNLKRVKQDKIRFTLFDEEYIDKATFELWGAESNTLIGPINPDGSSAFNVEEAWDVKMIISGVEHDAGTSVLGSEVGDLNTLTIGPLDPAVENASYFQLGTPHPEFDPSTYNVLLTLEFEGADQYVRAISFTINKDKVKPVGGLLQLVSMVPNTTNYNVMGMLALNGNLFTLPATGWNVLLESEVPAGTVRKHELLQKKGDSLININTALYTKKSQTKEYTTAVEEDQYFIFDYLNSKDIGGIHVNPSSFRVIITDEADGVVTNIYSADFSFGVLEDLDDLEVSEPGNSGEGVQEYYAGRGLSEIVDDYIKTFNVNVDDVTLEIFDQSNPLVNWLRVKDKGITFGKIQDIPSLTLIGKLTSGTGVPYAVPVITSITLSGASDLNIATSLAIKTYVDNKFTGTVSGLAGRIAKFATNTTLTYSILEESGISLTARQGIFVADNASNTNVRGFAVQEDGSTRFSFGKLGAAADFAFWRFADNGATVLGTPIGIERSTGKVTLETQLTILGSVLPPLVVSSTALVTNFNADLLDGQHGAYYLARANHTGTQLAATISDFSTAVRGTVLTGLSTTNGVISATDTILQAFGKVQGQLTGNISGTVGRLAKFTGTNAIGASILEESGIALIARQGVFVADNLSNSNVRGFVVQEGGDNRFSFGKLGAGADFAFWRYADDGTTVLGTPIGIERSTGKVTLETQLTINGTGIAPLVVASNVLVTNLNADLLDGQHGSYYLDWNNFTNVKSVLAGNGMTGGGVLTSNVTLTLGTPSTLDASTTNSVSGSTHTHAITTGNLVAGSNVSLSGTIANRLIGSGNVTISAVSMPWSGVTGTPTTLSGFGIVDAPTFGDLSTALSGKENTFSKGNLIAGSGISLSGTLTGRLVGSGDVTISVSGGLSGSGTNGYFAKWTGASSLGVSVMQDTGSEINIANTRSLGVEGPAAMRDYLHVWGYCNMGTSSNHGTLLIHQANSGTIDGSAALEIRSTSKGLLLPRMTSAQMLAISSPQPGLVVFQTDVGTSGIGAYIHYGGGVWYRCLPDF